MNSKMLNTNEALEKITDPGKFELLATSVLRKAEKEYASIIHTGVNKGKTVKSPLDGFCRVPGSDPPLFLLVHHTTVESKRLGEKWLHDYSVSKSPKAKPADDGDLIKAGREARKIRESSANAKFRVVLVTNRHLTTDFLNKVYKKAEELGLETDLWEQSRLVDFLDNTRKGHWLRKKYLGIEAERLSLDLLADLCKRSLKAFENEVSYLTEPDGWVPREVDDLVESGIRSREYTVQLLVGESGSGKSNVAYRALKRHIESGGYGVWAEAKSISDQVHLKSALDKVLRDLHQSLEPDAGKVALQLVQREKKRLLFVVDDVNRTHEPSEFVHKILRWSRPSQSDSNSKSLSLPHLAICPVLPKIWETKPYSDNSPAWINTVPVGSMSLEEGTEAILAAASRTRIRLTRIEAGDLADRLDNDPILIGFFTWLLPGKKVDELGMLAEDVFDKFMKDGIYKAMNASETVYLETEYHETLSSLSLHMLERRNLYPSFSDIEKWLQKVPDRLNHLRILHAHGMICRFEKDELIFRHDRIRDALLVKAMAKILAMGASDTYVLEEPFYAEIIGRALADSEYDQEILEHIRDYLPLSLFIAIRYIGTPQSDYHSGIVQQAKKWVQNIAARNLASDSVLGEICWTLARTDSPAVLDLTKELPKNALVYAARLRNGCAASGVLFFLQYDHATIDVFRDRLVEQAKERHGDELLGQLKMLLRDGTTRSVGTLKLAGFLGFTELQDAIADCWNITRHRSFVLPYAIWAATQCCGDEPAKLLGPLMEYWATLSCIAGLEVREIGPLIM